VSAGRKSREEVEEVRRREMGYDWIWDLKTIIFWIIAPML